MRPAIFCDSLYSFILGHFIASELSVKQKNFLQEKEVEENQAKR
jgi:hypothetical protein